MDFALEPDVGVLPFGGKAADAISIRLDSTLTMTALAPPNNRCRLRFRRTELFCVGLASDTEQREDFARDWTSHACGGNTESSNADENMKENNDKQNVKRNTKEETCHVDLPLASRFVH